MKIHMKLCKRIAKNLPREREARGLSQATLASLAGVSRPYLNQIESGEKDNLSLEMIEKIASALGVDPTRLMKE